MRQVLDKLIELQNLDTKLQELESLRGDLPQQVQRMKRELEEVKQAQQDRDEKLAAYRKEKAELEMDIKALEEKQKKYQAQLFEVTNNREYDAVTHELEAVKLDVEQKESRTLELMDLEQELDQAMESVKGEVEALTGQLETKRVELNKRLAKTEKEEIALQDRKANILHRMTPRIKSSYERIRKAKNGFAVTPVIRGSCGGCFTTLPPQRILEIRQMDKLYLCEVCGRMLVWDEKIAEGA